MRKAKNVDQRQATAGVKVRERLDMGWGRTDRVVHTEGVVAGRMEAQLANQRDSWARGPTVRSKWMSMRGRDFRLDADTSSTSN